MKIAQHETAINAYHTHELCGKAGLQRGRILNFIRAQAGCLAGFDWSIGELAHALSMEKSTVSARVNELLNGTHELVEKPKRKDRISGITIRPVGLPPVGQMEMRLFQ